ncbi:hypothetical protein [Lysinibacillus mangiferihumi]|uniref:hypothetical protein n=1 Tax=Lysinibacillus mangiferihumi TaxID=1130819 RepID=UPI0010BEBB15|nr:hypothetical protein [Lysinibacillus mangiferihumi]
MFGRKGYPFCMGWQYEHEYFSQDNSNTLENSVENASQTDALDNLVTWVFNDGLCPFCKNHE